MSSPQIQARLTAADDALTLSVRNLGAVAVQLTGTWTGTVTFEATVDGVTWVAFNMVPAASATPASTATSTGAWSANCAGYSGWRARFSTASSGTVVATAQNADAAGRF